MVVQGFSGAIPPQTEYAKVSQNQETNLELMAFFYQRSKIISSILTDAKTLLGYHFLVVQIHGYV
jgi:hypothetical protein